jgi:hypothetical protein
MREISCGTNSYRRHPNWQIKVKRHRSIPKTRSQHIHSGSDVNFLLQCESRGAATNSVAFAMADPQLPVPMTGGAGRTMGEIHSSKPTGAASGLPVVTSVCAQRVNEAKSARRRRFESLGGMPDGSGDNQSERMASTLARKLNVRLSSCQRSWFV